MERSCFAEESALPVAAGALRLLGDIVPDDSFETIAHGLKANVLCMLSVGQPKRSTRSAVVCNSEEGHCCLPLQVVLNGCRAIFPGNQKVAIVRA